MQKILKIEDAKIIKEHGKEVTRYVFNDDKIVRVDTKTDEVITKNVPKDYLNLISIYATNTKIEKEENEEETERRALEKRVEIIRSGKGAGLGVFLGFLLAFTIVGPFIAAFFSFRFLNDISDEDYLKTADPSEINFRKGFYSSAIFGLIVAIICCSQWKADMISVLDGDPSKYSENKHICFKVWACISIVYSILNIFALIIANTSMTYRYRF